LLQRGGQGWAGWYTPGWVDRVIERTLIRLKAPSPPSADRLLPQFQSLAVGDIIGEGPEHRSYWKVLDVQPQQAIVYHSVRHPWRRIRSAPAIPVPCRGCRRN
jgi:hypothetical protein